VILASSVCGLGQRLVGGVSDAVICSPYLVNCGDGVGKDCGGSGNKLWVLLRKREQAGPCSTISG
jgi:hypothetical protein